MKKIFISIIIIFMVSCLKPVRDNEFDPLNPDKAYLTGYLTSADGTLRHSMVKLYTLDYKIYDSTFSDENGKYEFTKIDPGIYKLMASHPLYLPVEYYPESLPAGSSDTVDLYFDGRLFTFDNDTVGTIEPADFEWVLGNWQVIEDNTAPSKPNVYNCNDVYGLVFYNNQVWDFGIQTDFKINYPLPGGFCITGIVLRFQDDDNYYLIEASKDSLALIKVKDGVVHILDAVYNSVVVDQWYTLKVEVWDNVFKVYFNDEMKFEKTDDDFTEGKTGLMIKSPAPDSLSVNFDNVIIFR